MQEKLQNNNLKYKERADTKRRVIVFKEEDLVWVYANKDRYPMGKYNKLKSKKIGTCKIMQRINDNAYEVELPKGWQINNSFNVSDLYKF